MNFPPPPPDLSGSVRTPTIWYLSLILTNLGKSCGAKSGGCLQK
ncbi:MAG: hypothetical protein ACTS73_02855 [Arsenophonus sp. NEOnobi-MAG3]